MFRASTMSGTWPPGQPRGLDPTIGMGSECLGSFGTSRNISERLGVLGRAAEHLSKFWSIEERYGQLEERVREFGSI